jgi:hypothetical protein
MLAEHNRRNTMTNIAQTTVILHNYRITSIQRTKKPSAKRDQIIDEQTRHVPPTACGKGDRTVNSYSNQA